MQTLFKFAPISEDARHLFEMIDATGYQATMVSMTVLMIKKIWAKP